MESPSSEVFQGCLDVELGKWLWVTLPEQGLGQVTSEFPASLSQSVMLRSCWRQFSLVLLSKPKP